MKRIVLVVLVLSASPAAADQPYPPRDPTCALSRVALLAANPGVAAAVVQKRMSLVGTWRLCPPSARRRSNVPHEYRPPVVISGRWDRPTLTTKEEK